MDKKGKGWPNIEKVRITSQVLFFSLFLFLFFQTDSKGRNELDYPVKVFLELDPLNFIVNLLSTRSLITIPFLAILILIITFFLGRVFCGFICPLGFTNDLFGKLKKRGSHPKKRWLTMKYYLLFGLLASSLLSLNLSGIFDPLCILLRSFTLSLYPFSVNLVGSKLFGLREIDFNQSLFFWATYSHHLGPESNR